jgi:hypothetical protein
MALGVILAVGRFGSVINDNISANYTAEHVMGAYCVGATFCTVSVLAAIAAAVLDARHEALARQKALRRRGGTALSSPKGGPSAAAAAAGSKMTVAGALADLRRFERGYWLLCPVCVLGFPAITSFNGVSSALLAARWAAEGQPAAVGRVNSTMGILYSVSAVLASFYGYLIDRTRRRAAFLMLALASVSACHLLFALTDAPAEFLLVRAACARARVCVGKWFRRDSGSIAIYVSVVIEVV